MTCKKCGGKVVVDRMFSENVNRELSCLTCGKRWFLKPSNVFAQWLEKQELKVQNA